MSYACLLRDKDVLFCFGEGRRSTTFVKGPHKTKLPRQNTKYSVIIVSSVTPRVVLFLRRISKHIKMPENTPKYLETLTKEGLKGIWRTADAVCFDVDSTVVEEEGIDELAEFCGVGEAVRQW